MPGVRCGPACSCYPCVISALIGAGIAAKASIDLVGVASGRDDRAPEERPSGVGSLVYPAVTAGAMAGLVWTGVANRLALAAIHGYQRFAPNVSTCRFEPSCSAYGAECYRRYPFLRATAKTGWRVARCNPWNHGPGVDRP